MIGLVIARSPERAGVRQAPCRFFPQGFGVDLLGVYLIWIAVAVILYERQIIHPLQFISSTKVAISLAADNDLASGAPCPAHCAPNPPSP